MLAVRDLCIINEILPKAHEMWAQVRYIIYLADGMLAVNSDELEEVGAITDVEELDAITGADSSAKKMNKKWKILNLNTRLYKKVLYN